MIGQASGTFVPDALVQVVAVAAVLYGSPISGAILFAMFGVSCVGMLWLLVSRGRTETDVHWSFEFVGVTEPLLRLLSSYFLAAAGGYSKSSRTADHETKGAAIVFKRVAAPA